MNDRRLTAIRSVAAGVLAATLLGGCTTVVTQPAAPRDSVPVLLVDYGRTSAVVLPAPGGRSAGYAYGDWNWYALRRTGPLDGIGAMLTPSQGTLGRHQYDEAPDSAAVRTAVLREAEDVHLIRVERRRAEALRLGLDDIFRDNADTLVHAPSLKMDFVHHPQRYWAFTNSNHKVAGWLRELGCDVRGATMLSSWRVVERR